MDFFEHQEVAQKQTRKLVVFFGLAVVLTIIAVYAAAALGFSLLQSLAGDPTQVQSGSYEFLRVTTPLHDGLGWFDLELFLLISLTTGMVIFIGSSIKTFQLSKGGHSVATLLGGRPVPVSTQDPKEQRLLNVVEEMAIASGTAVPSVYVLNEEKSINAFAAGHSTRDAAIGITRGSLELLDRDELQGVIGHEFSHILNGDMGLNMRLASLTYGILFIAETGMILLRLPFHVALYSSGRDRRGGIPPHFILVLFIVGGTLAAIGSIGGLFSRLIKSAISRQREFLADSSAVQFTRNPAGLAGALKKIGGLNYGSRIRSNQAAQASHFYFANGVSASWMKQLSTHPPLIERLLLLDPSFDGQFPKVKFPEKELTEREKLRNSLSQKRRQDNKKAFVELAAVSTVIEALGRPDNPHLRYTLDVTQSIPEAVYRAAHEPFGARALVYAILLDTDEAIRATQQNVLRENADPMVFAEFRKLIPEVDALPSEQRLPAVDMAIPALRELTPPQYHIFDRNCSALIEADQAVSLREYALRRVLSRHLSSAFSETTSKPTIRHRSLTTVTGPIQTVLGALAFLESDTYEEAQQAFQAGVRQIQLYNASLKLPAYEACGLGAVDEALSELEGLTPSLKKNVIFACASVVSSNERIGADESELLRAFADSLDCPIPPFARSFS